MCLLCNYLKSINWFTNKCSSTYGFWLYLLYLQTYLIKLKYFSYMIYYLDLLVRTSYRSIDRSIDRERERDDIAINIVYQQLPTGTDIIIFIVTGSSILRAVILVIMFVEFFVLYYTSVSQAVSYVRLQHSFPWSNIIFAHLLSILRNRWHPILLMHSFPC